MNVKELIERLERLIGYGSRDYIERDRVLELVKQLDEPETGHADEAPRYLKNILARLRELPVHNREVWLKVIMSEFKQDFSHAKWREGYEQGKLEGMVEREKVKVPPFVADWIEYFKKYSGSLYGSTAPYSYYGHAITDDFVGDVKKTLRWIRNNSEVYARAWLDGYEVEKEKRYKIEVKGVSENSVLIHDKTEECWFFEDDNNEDTIYVYHTRKELEEANFGWVFDCEGVEVQEVE